LDTTTRARLAPRGDDGTFAAADRRPAACGGRVLSADHAPQTPQAPSEDVSAATRPSTVLAQPGTTARVTIRQRLLPSRPQLLRRDGAPPLSAGASRHRGLPPRGRANGAPVTPRDPKGRPCAIPVDGRCDAVLPRAAGARLTAGSRILRAGTPPPRPASGGNLAQARLVASRVLRPVRVAGTGTRSWRCAFRVLAALREDAPHCVAAGARRPKR
jgi:hypothetical protein